MAGGRPLRARPEGFDERAPNMTYAQIRQEWGCSSECVRRWLADIGIERSATRKEPIPEGFAEVAAKWTSAQLQEHFGLSCHVVARMRRTLGINVEHRAPARPIPLGFREVARTMSAAFLCDRFGAGLDTVRRWRAELGIVVTPGRKAPVRAPTARGPEDMAANYLRRTCPVYRCRGDGQQDQRGKHWRYGRSVLTPDEMVSLARRKGFDPDSWRRIG